MPKLAAKPRTFRTPEADVFTLAMQPGADGQPARVQIPLLPLGTFEHPSFGTLEWTTEKFDQMIANFGANATGIVPMLNYDHSTYNPAAAEARAAGWFVELARTPAGLDAVVELTPAGEEAVRNREYRYISAEVADEWARSTGETVANVICGGALTNFPFHDTMRGLFSRREKPMPNAALVASFSLELAKLHLARVPGDLSFDDIEDALREALRREAILEGADPDDYWDERPYVVAVFPTFVIYRESYWRDECPCWKRAYSVDGETVTLAAEKVQVEEVWVEVARDAFAIALKSARPVTTLSARTGADGQPARAKEKRMDLKRFFRTLLGLAESATEEEIAVAANRLRDGKTLAAAPIEPVEPTAVHAFAAPEGHVLLKAAEHDALKAQSARAVTAEQALETERKQFADAQAAEAVDALIQSGRILPAKREDALAFAQSDLARFAKLYDGAKPVIDLSSKGGLRPAGGDGESETFEALSLAIAERERIPLGEAALLAAEERPELYEARHNRGRGN